MKKPLSAAAIILFFTCTLHGAGSAIDKNTVREGLHAVYSLDYPKAWEIFDQLKTEHPKNPIVQGMIALTSYNELLFETRNLAVYRYGMPSPFDDIHPPEETIQEKEGRFLDANNTLMRICDDLIQKNPQDPTALYFKGMAYENMAMYAITLYGKKREAASFATTAGDIHKEVLQLDPDLVDAKTSRAVPQYVVGSLPFGIRWIGLLMGIRGDKQGAMEKLNEVVDKGLYRAPDALLVMGLLNVWKGDAQTAVSSFTRIRKMYERNFLLDISLAVAYDEAVKDPMAAIGVYNQLLSNLTAKAPGIYPAEIHFRIGRSYMELEDYNKALLHFQKALDSQKGNVETEPLVYYNMALVHEKLGQKKQAKECYRRAAEYSGPTQLIEDEIKRARKKGR